MVSCRQGLRCWVRGFGGGQESLVAGPWGMADGRANAGFRLYAPQSETLKSGQFVV